MTEMIVQLTKDEYREIQKLVKHCRITLTNSSSGFKNALLHFKSLKNKQQASFTFSDPKRCKHQQILYQVEEKRLEEGKKIQKIASVFKKRDNKLKRKRYQEQQLSQSSYQELQNYIDPQYKKEIQKTEKAVRTQDHGKRIELRAKIIELLRDQTNGISSSKIKQLLYTLYGKNEPKSSIEQQLSEICQVLRGSKGGRLFYLKEELVKKKE